MKNFVTMMMAAVAIVMGVCSCGDDKDEPHEVGNVERDACRHNPSRECRSDVRTHDDTDGLRKCEQRGVDERNGHYRCCRRTLYRCRHAHTCQHSREAVGGHAS